MCAPCAEVWQESGGVTGVTSDQLLHSALSLNQGVASSLRADWAWMGMSQNSCHSCHSFRCNVWTCLEPELRERGEGWDLQDKVWSWLINCNKVSVAGNDFSCSTVTDHSLRLRNVTAQLEPKPRSEEVRGHWRPRVNMWCSFTLVRRPPPPPPPLTPEWWRC